MKFSDRILVFASNLSSQPHLVSIRNSFFQMMPLVLAGSFYVMLNNAVLNLPIFSGNEAITTFKNVGDSVFRGSLGALALLSAFLMAYHLAVHYKKDGLIYGTVSFGCYIGILPSIQKINGVDVWGILTFGDTSASALFVAILTALTSVEILRLLNDFKPLQIKMPDSVPPAIAKSFNVLIPVCITISIFGLISLFCNSIIGKPLNTIIQETLQKPMVNALQHPIGFFIVISFQNFLWALGIHGALVLGPIIDPIYLTALQQNIDLVQAGMEPINIFSKPFIEAFTQMGGGGNTIGLIIALFIFSKREDERAVGKLGILPGLFNINEPIIFGLPVVLNPIYGIPLVLVPAINAAVAYLATSWGLINKTIVITPWTTPPVLNAYFATGGDWRAALLSILLIILSVFIYTPFVILSSRVADKNIL